MILRNSHWKKIELVPGWLDYRNAQLFVTLSSSSLLGTGNFLEVGVFFGKSAVAMGYGRNNDEKIVLIDPFETILIPSNNNPIVPFCPIIEQLPTHRFFPFCLIINTCDGTSKQ
jgi:hypothetical protein